MDCIGAESANAPEFVLHTSFQEKNWTLTAEDSRRLTYSVGELTQLDRR